MIPAHFVFAADQEHTDMTLLHLSQEDVSEEEEVKLSQAACEEENSRQEQQEAWPGRYREQAHLCGYGPAAGEGGSHPCPEEDPSQVQEE